MKANLVLCYDRVSFGWGMIAYGPSFALRRKPSHDQKEFSILYHPIIHKALGQGCSPIALV